MIAATATRVLRPPRAGGIDDVNVEAPAARDARRPLRGRIVLVIGAEDASTRRTALHLSARGAALIVAGVDREAVLMTAGLAAASGATSRVIDENVSLLSGTAVFDAATRLLARPTDVLIAEGIMTNTPMLAHEVRTLLGPTAFGCVVPARPAGGERAFAAATCAAFEASLAGADASAIRGPSATRGPP